MRATSLLRLSALALVAVIEAAPASAQTTCGPGYSEAENGDVTMAVCRGDVPALERAFDGRRGDVNGLDPRGLSPLHVAFHASSVYWQPGYNTEVITYLLVHGAHPNEQPYLAEAAAFGRSDIAKLLLSHGADVNQALPGGRTPLHTAARCDFRLSSDLEARRTVELLLASGANIKARTARGQSPLDVVPTPCSFEPALCEAARLPTVTWPSGSCKETYILLKSRLTGGRLDDQAGA